MGWRGGWERGGSKGGRGNRGLYCVSFSLYISACDDLYQHAMFFSTLIEEASYKKLDLSPACAREGCAPKNMKVSERVPSQPVTCFTW